MNEQLFEFNIEVWLQALFVTNVKYLASFNKWRQAEIF